MSKNAVLDSYTFTLDNEGNISETQHADGTKFVYAYDQRHRVTEADLKDSGNNVLRTFGYSYDAADNMTGKTRTVTSPASSDSWVYGYDNANEQTSVTMNGGTAETRTFDAWGRLATRTQGTSSATYGYRYGGMLYSYTTNYGGESAETLQYRGDRRLYSRTSGTTTKVYRYDRGWNAINEEDGSGNLTACSVYAPNSAVGERLAYTFGALANVALYAYHDQVGSIRAWRWPNKSLLGRNDFDPYGWTYNKYASLPVDFALHVQDPYTLLYHAPYREYAGGWCRWISRDPLGMSNGPNMFAYVGDMPMRNNDPSGLGCVCTWKVPWYCPWCAPQWVCREIPNSCASEADKKYEDDKKACKNRNIQLLDRPCGNYGDLDVSVVVPIPEPDQYGACLYKAYQDYQAALLKCAFG